VIVYCTGSSGEKLSAQDILNRCLHEQEEDIPEMLVIETMAGSSWTKASTANMIVNHLLSACERLGKDSLDFYQVPKSFLFPSRILANGLVAALDSGYCNYVGV
jgi:hypothetical protein